jgi:uncharacterized protein
VSRHVSIDRGTLAEFCRKYHIIRLAIFGSALRDDFRPDSDVDVLVEFQPGHVPGLDFITIERELSGLLERPMRGYGYPKFLESKDPQSDLVERGTSLCRSVTSREITMCGNTRDVDSAQPRDAWRRRLVVRRLRVDCGAWSTGRA